MSDFHPSTLVLADHLVRKGMDAKAAWREADKQVTELVNLQIEELSLVDEPANEQATVAIHKSKQEEKPMLSKADLENAICCIAKSRFPELNEAQAVAKFLDTEDGQVMYAASVQAETIQKHGVQVAKRAVAEAAIEGLARTIQKRNPDMTFHQAYFKAFNEADPELLEGLA